MTRILSSTLRCSLMVTSLVTIVPVSGAAQDRAWKAARTDEIFSEWNRPGSPGCAVGVIQDGDLTFERGYGMANLDYDIPLTGQSVFYIASTSKQFAAAAIALLALRGELSLDDDVREHIPEMPVYRHAVTVRHLVHHTSGVRDYLTLRSIAGRSFEDFFDIQWGVDLIARQRSLNFDPGAEFLYSNSGYLLLAEIVGRVSGTSLEEFGREHFFEPLGMTATHWGGDVHRVVPNRVISYSEEGDGEYRRWLKNFHAMGDGNLLTSVEDLAKWDRVFYDTTERWRPLVDLMHTPGRLNDGDTLDYAFGLFHGEYRDRRTVAHGGAFLGFRTEMLRFPDDRFTSIVLCNFASASPSRYARRVADAWLFGDEGPVPTDTPSSVATPPETRIELPRPTLARLAGVYRNPTSPVGDVIITLGERDLVLEAAGAEFRLAPLASDRFRSETGPTTLNLHFDTEAEPEMVRVWQEGGEELVFSKTELPTLPEPALNAFAGSFYSSELDATFLIERRGDTLYAQRPGADESPMRPVGDDAFALAGWTITFTRDATGAPTGFSLDAGRVRGLRFDRR